MYVRALIDLTERGRAAGPELMAQHVAERATVQIYPPTVEHVMADHEQSLSEALSAVRRCRLIAEGHATKIEFLAATDTNTADPEFYMPAQGRELRQRNDF